MGSLWRMERGRESLGLASHFGEGNFLMLKQDTAHFENRARMMVDHHVIRRDGDLRCNIIEVSAIEVDDAVTSRCQCSHDSLVGNQPDDVVISRSR